MKMYSHISSVASLIGDPTRASILVTLIDGRSLPAGDLAELAHVSPQTASAHFTKLVEGGLLTVEKHGRHRYYRLAGPEIARALEAIGGVTSPSMKVQSLSESFRVNALQFARTCYGHLAGKVGVALTDILSQKGILEECGLSYVVTDLGHKWLRDFGVKPLTKNHHYENVPHHVDWTERRYHMGGPLALTITNRLLDLHWIAPGRVRRSIRITELGKQKLAGEFGMDIALPS